MFISEEGGRRTRKNWNGRKEREWKGEEGEGLGKRRRRSVGGRLRKRVSEREELRDKDEGSKKGRERNEIDQVEDTSTLKV